MAVMTAADAATNFFKLMDFARQSHEPVIISGESNNVVLVSEEDWNAIQETLYLCSIPGMKESILSARNEPLTESVEELDWRTSATANELIFCKK